MKAAWTFVICIVVIVGSSCGLQMDRDYAEMMRLANQYVIKSNIEFEEEKKRFAKDVADYKAKEIYWRQKNKMFLNSLSDEELKAYSEFAEAYKNNNEAKAIIARRNFISLISDSPKKLTTSKNLSQEAVEICKKYDELNGRLQDIERREYKIAKSKEAMKEERKHEETVSAIKGVSSSIDNMRFDVEQWRMQKFLGMR